MVMVCETFRFNKQSVEQRRKQVADTVKEVEKGLANGKIKVVVGAQGAIAFQGLEDSQRNRVADACIYRRILSTGSAMARMKLAAAGNVNKAAIAQGVHAHEGPGGQLTWHEGH
jgi:hypothetical protein